MVRFNLKFLSLTCICAAFMVIGVTNTFGVDIWVSFYEIYCGKLYDLLHERQALIAREDGKGNVVIVNLTERQVISLDQLML